MIQWLYIMLTSALEWNVSNVGFEFHGTICIRVVHCPVVMVADDQRWTIQRIIFEIFDYGIVGTSINNVRTKNVKHLLEYESFHQQR